MKSVTTEKFRSLFATSSLVHQTRIKSAHALWAENPAHPSLRFKKVHPHLPVYSVRVDLDWRAVGLLDGDTLIWFWVGPHAEYEALLKSL